MVAMLATADRDRSTPVEVSFGTPQRQRRATVFFRVILVIPQVFVLWFIGVAALVLVVVGWFAALFTGRLPDPIAEFLRGYLRWEARVSAYAFLLTDAYPPFSLDPSPGYPVDVAVRTGRLNRWAVFFRYFLAIPAGIVAGALGLGMAVFSIVLWVATLVRGEPPGWMFGATAAALRYRIRYEGFYMMVTSFQPAGVMGDGTYYPPPPGGGGGLVPPPPPPPPYDQPPDFGGSGAYGTPPPPTPYGQPPPPPAVPLLVPPAAPPPPPPPPPTPPPPPPPPPPAAPPAASGTAPVPLAIPDLHATAAAAGPASAGLPSLPLLPPPSAPSSPPPPPGTSPQPWPPGPAVPPSSAGGMPAAGAPVGGSFFSGGPGTTTPVAPPGAALPGAPPTMGAPSFLGDERWRLLLTPGARRLVVVFFVLGALAYVSYFVAIPTFLGVTSARTLAEDQTNSAVATLGDRFQQFDVQGQACQQNSNPASVAQCFESNDAGLAADLRQFTSTISGIDYPGDVSGDVTAAENAASQASATLTRLSATGPDLTGYLAAVQSSGVVAQIEQVGTAADQLRSALATAYA